MSIRRATVADQPALDHLYQERLALLVQADKRIAPEDVRWFGREAGAVWVGDFEGVIGGYLSVWWEDEWLIDHMALDAHTYYPGLARALVNEARRTAAAADVTRLLTRVPVSHPVEQAFWRAIGASSFTKAAPSGYEWMSFIV